MLPLCALSALVCCGGGRGGGWFADLTFFPVGERRQLTPQPSFPHFAPWKKKNHLKRASDTKRIFKNRGREQQQGLFCEEGGEKLNCSRTQKLQMQSPPPLPAEERRGGGSKSGHLDANGNTWSLSVFS